jgi:hypothetical protein
VVKKRRAVGRTTGGRRLHLAAISAADVDNNLGDAPLIRTEQNVVRPSGDDRCRIVTAVRRTRARVRRGCLRDGGAGAGGTCAAVRQHRAGWQGRGCKYLLCSGLFIIRWVLACADAWRAVRRRFFCAFAFRGRVLLNRHLPGADLLGRVEGRTNYSILRDVFFGGSAASLSTFWTPVAGADAGCWRRCFGVA